MPERIEYTTTHELKTWPIYFEKVISGEKTFEIRYNDRGFHVGDFLRLREWDDTKEEYTGRSVTVRVTYMTNFDQLPDRVVMAIYPCNLRAVPLEARNVED